ncbi:3374_t:CDS:1, partial [Scutellospora calospora]
KYKEIKAKFKSNKEEYKQLNLILEEVLIKKANKMNSDKQKEMQRVESQNTNKKEREKQAKIKLEEIERKRDELREEQAKIQIN